MIFVVKLKWKNVGVFPFVFGVLLVSSEVPSYDY